MSEILTAYKSIDEALEAERPYLKETEAGILYDNTGLKNTVESQRRADEKPGPKRKDTAANSKHLKTNQKNIAKRKPM